MIDVGVWVVAHQHGFNDLSVLQFKQRFLRLLIGRILNDFGLERGEVQVLGKFCAQGNRKIGELVCRVIEVMIQPLPDLLCAIGRFILTFED